MSSSPLSGDPPSPPNLQVALTRARDGRWLAGVCAGLARRGDLPPRSVRTAFLLMGLIGGIGGIAYLACWLIIPAEGDDEVGTAGVRGIVILAQACAAGVGLATLAAAGAAATIFGFGWVVLLIAGIALVAALASWPRVGPGWALLPTGALVLPAIAMTLGGVSLAAESRDVGAAPQSVADLPRGGYSAGLGSLLVDLRNTVLPARGTVNLTINAGIRRTIVALPANRCVFVDLHYDIAPFAARAASILTGRTMPSSEVTLFGNLEGRGSGEDDTAPGPAPDAPVLDIHFHSAGGGIYVRDYPDNIDPQFQPDWPGYPVTLEPRPDVTGTPRLAALHLIDGWLLRRRVQSASAAAIERLMPGPCGASAVQSGQPATAMPGYPYVPPPYGWQAGTGGAEPDPVPAATGGGLKPYPVPAAPAAPKAPTLPGGDAVTGGVVSGSSATVTTMPGSGGAAATGGVTGTAGTTGVATRRAGTSGTGRTAAAGRRPASIHRAARKPARRPSVPTGGAGR